MFSYVSREQWVPKDQSLRAIRQLVDELLRELSRDFDPLYARVGRPSIPPKRLLHAQLFQIFYSIRSQRLLMEQLAPADRTGFRLAEDGCVASQSQGPWPVKRPLARVLRSD